jgi:DNA-binding NtrC family response regulator
MVLTERGDLAPAAYYLREPGLLRADAQIKLAEQLEEGAGPRVYAGCSSTQAPLLPRLRDVLSVLRVRLPELRESMEALPQLVEWMLSRLNDEGGFLADGIAPAALDVLRAHNWPGHLTELFAVLRSARAQAAQGATQAGRIEREHLPLALRVASEPVAGPPRPIQMEHVLEQAERRMIRLALERAGGNRTLAAELLSIPRARLLRRIEALGIGEKDEGKPGHG